MSMTGTSTVTFVNEGVTSTIGGHGISTSGPNGSVTITNEGVTSTIAGSGISVSGNTGSVTIASVAPVYNYSEVTTSSIVNSSVYTSVDLLGLSTLRAAAPITAWATALFTDLNSSSGSEIDIRLLINGTAGPTQRVSITKNHHQSFPLMGAGVGPSPGGHVAISMQASTIVGDAQVTFANAMAFSDMYQTL
jgi:hypothetical protein